MKKLIILPLVIAGILFSACEEKTSGSKKAPYFSLKTPDGKVLKLSDYKGKVVILNFFATWCAPCRYEIPDFVEFYNKNKGKIEIIGIAVNSPVSQVKNMIKKYKIRYPVVISDGKVEKLYGGIRYIPTTFIITKDGKIYKKHEGFMRKEDLEEILKDLL